MRAGLGLPSSLRLSDEEMRGGGMSCVGVESGRERGIGRRQMRPFSTRLTSPIMSRLEAEWRRERLIEVEVRWGMEESQPSHFESQPLSSSIPPFPHSGTSPAPTPIAPVSESPQLHAAHLHPCVIIPAQTTTETESRPRGSSDTESNPMQPLDTCQRPKVKS